MTAAPGVQPDDADSEALVLLDALVGRHSVTPDDAGCQPLIAERLTAAGFDCEHLPFNAVSNLWARHGDGKPLLVFAGHTDVVPPGDDAAWQTPPFEAVTSDGLVFGRGTADMKGGLAAMVIAAERFVKRYPGHAGSVAFLITSDEEGRAVDGTRRVVEALAARDIAIDFALVGEPSSSRTVGDVIRVGRRGSLSGYLRVAGVQGHAAYPEKADNPVHRFAPALLALCERQWDSGNAHFPPTTLQIVNVAAGTGAANVTPPALTVEFNFRYSTEWDAPALQAEVEALLDTFSLDYQLDWIVSGEPFLTGAGKLVDAVVAAVEEETGQPPSLSTGGGTSDGRFLAPAGAEVVELGPVNASIHQVNECVSADDVLRLCRIYRRVLETLLGDAPD